VAAPRSGVPLRGKGANMYQVYILRSEKTGKHYIGSTEFIEDRLVRHNSGFVKSTKGGIPWVCIYNEPYESRSVACQREKEIKSYKGGIKFKRLLGLWKD